jgi:hypothetical protein
VVSIAEIKDYAIGALTLALLISLGFAVQSDSTHLCRQTLTAMHCDRLSSTLKTCYPTPGTTLGKKVCPSGWELILKELPEAEPMDHNHNIGAEFLCNFNNCTKIK